MTTQPAMEGGGEKQYRKVATITARQWFKMGDHPAVVPIVVTQRDPARTSHCLPNQTPPPNVNPNLQDYFPGMEKTHGYISTLEGGHIVSPGDWIATGVRGEHWAIKPDIFAETYAGCDEASALRAVGAGKGEAER